MIASPSNRWAGPAIAGYVYQFDYSIKRILGSSDDDQFVIEGLEDIDITDINNERRAVQVKYHEAARFNGLKSLRDPIKEMFFAYAHGLAESFTLHAHYEASQNLGTSLTTAEVMDCLTERSRGGIRRYWVPLNEEVIQGFADRLEISQGPDRKTQRREVMAMIGSSTDATDDECEHLLYPTALAVIAEIAMTRDVRQRTIGRQEFINKVDRRKQLWSGWHARLQSREQWVRSLKAMLRIRRSLRATLVRGLCLDGASLNDGGLQPLVHELATKQFGPGALVGTKPWTIICSDSAVALVVKRYLVQHGLSFNDGFEWLGFSATLFEIDPVVTVNKPGTKLVHVSHAIRVVTLDSLRNSGHILALDVLVAASGQMSEVAQLVSARDYVGSDSLTLDEINSIIRSSS
ncbi:hypothetical protein [Curtobacterium sp. Leaf261]|uniref:hypothetical protein n=1 Tax=Curtobacterium sp. Leaf261 TaxID=1736311 RepID=UPI0012E302DA|nr:hypothetical protein [Curtobacterium sp. Leaf261]